ncbi:MAG TPA: nuclear transport factor 2 family protein [Gemmatimonadaceae bacterium]|nr:nuclear transport factor 2 family protein [Gemmatimonadaceae bacterium]
MRNLAAALAVLLATGQLGAQTRGVPVPQAPAPTSSRPVPRPNPLLPIKLEDQWTTAVVKRDAQTFERLLAPNFVYTEDAQLMSRDDVIRSVTGPDRVTWARNEGMRAHDFGDVQVITGILHLRGRGSGSNFDRRYRFTDTWQRRNGQWQMIAAQDYLIPARR